MKESLKLILETARKHMASVYAIWITGSLCIVSLASREAAFGQIYSSCKEVNCTAISPELMSKLAEYDSAYSWGTLAICASGIIGIYLLATHFHNLDTAKQQSEPQDSASVAQ
jgi:hypothetical protein